MLKKQLICLIMNSALLLMTFDVYAYSNTYSACKTTSNISINFTNPPTGSGSPDAGKCEALCKSSDTLSPYSNNSHLNSYYDSKSKNCYCC